MSENQFKATFHKDNTVSVSISVPFTIEREDYNTWRLIGRNGNVIEAFFSKDEMREFVENVCNELIVTKGLYK